MHPGQQFYAFHAPACPIQNHTPPQPPKDRLTPTQTTTWQQIQQKTQFLANSCATVLSTRRTPTDIEQELLNHLLDTIRHDLDRAFPPSFNGAMTSFECAPSAVHSGYGLPRSAIVSPNNSIHRADRGSGTNAVGCGILRRAVVRGISLDAPQHASASSLEPVTRRPTNRRKRMIQNNLPCSWCRVTQSPEWRSGPNGNRTLCNACGLQYAKRKREMAEQDHPDGFLASVSPTPEFRLTHPADFAFQTSKGRSDPLGPAPDHTSTFLRDDQATVREVSQLLNN